MSSSMKQWYNSLGHMNNPRKPAPTPPIAHDESQRRGQLVLRTLPILLIPFLVTLVTGLIIQWTLGAPFSSESHIPPPFSPLVPIVVIVIFFSALIILVRLGRSNLSVFLLVGAWTLVTTLFAVKMGVTSIWPALLIAPICAAGLLIDGTASVALAALATVLILARGWLEIQGIALGPEELPPPNWIGENFPMLAAGFWVATFWTIAALTVLLASGMQRALISSRKQAAALSELSAQLEQRVQTQTAALLAQERESATLEERARVAREIHDTIAQGLTGIIVQLGAAQRAAAVASPDAPKHIELAQRMARESLAEARRSIWNLRSPVLEHATFHDALEGVVARQTQANLVVTFELQGEEWTVPAAVESTLLRVCQEALVNVTKHSNATLAKVLLEYAATYVRLSVRDDGVGFDGTLQSTDDIFGSFGLQGMRERVSALGGTLELLSDGGAHVIATIPRQEANP
jgi:signal transduction histidine kinase